MVKLEKWETWTPGTQEGESITRRKRSRFASRDKQSLHTTEIVELPVYTFTKNPEGGYLVHGAGYHTPMAVGSITKARLLADRMGEEIITAEGDG